MAVANQDLTHDAGGDLKMLRSGHERGHEASKLASSITPADSAPPPCVGGQQVRTWGANLVS